MEKREALEIMLKQWDYISLNGGNKENAINIYSNHNKEVINYFKDRPQDLLILDFTKGDNWEKLCGFLGRSLPAKPFPHYNRWTDTIKSQIGLKNDFRFFRKRIKNSLLIKYIDWKGYW